MIILRLIGAQKQRRKTIETLQIALKNKLILLRVCHHKISDSFNYGDKPWVFMNHFSFFKRLDLNLKPFDIAPDKNQPILKSAYAFILANAKLCSDSVHI